jgi:hypothetical protein
MSSVLRLFESARKIDAYRSGALRHERFEFRFGALVVEEGCARGAEEARELSP